MSQSSIYGWKLDQLKSQLGSRKEIKAWIITQEHTHRRERYFLLDQDTLGIDQDRETHAQSIQVRMFVNLNGKPGRQGEISKKFFPSHPLKEQIDAAVDAAMQTDHQAWDLPREVPSKLPNLATSDPRIAEDIERVMSELTDRISKAVTKKRPTVFNSAELFLSLHDRELHLSNGLTHRSSQSRIYAESAYSMNRKLPGGEIQSDEYLNTQWSVSMDDLSVEKLFDETSERAEHSLEVQKPKTGKYPVIVDAEVLATLFNDQVSQLSAANAYNRLPYIKPGDAWIPEAQGDLMSLSLDPTLEFGADTTAVSDMGVPQLALKLVEDNKVLATSADKQYADYLAIPVTTNRGNVVINAGKLSHQELTRHAPQVIEILQFSGLFADANSGTFSSEIRLAKLYDNVRGTVTYIKGGSLSGSFRDNFKGVKLSKDRVKRAHFDAGSPRGRGYFGPEFALLSDVSIVG